MMEADVYEKTERERLQKLMNRNLHEPVGYVLPLHYSHRRDALISNAWQFKTPHLVLLTGDSSVGLRLPLGSLPRPLEAQLEIYPERNAFVIADALLKPDAIAKKVRSRRQARF